MSSPEKGPEEEFLEWEYTLAAQSDILWSAACIPLVRAADTLWQRAVRARSLWAEFYPRPGEGVNSCARPLAPDELSALDDGELDRVALMLLGLSIENAAKTLIVREKPTVVSDARLHLKSHDLVALLERGGIELTESEKRHLTIVKDYVTWLGRYPVPLAADGDHGPASAPGAWVAHRMGDPAETWSAARAVLERALARRDKDMFRPGAI
jgi:hypothetical protein